jgi:hypothetical protein
MPAACGSPTVTAGGAEGGVLAGSSALAAAAIPKNRIIANVPGRAIEYPPIKDALSARHGIMLISSSLELQNSAF